ncbi:MAG: radical SAM protein [Pseudobdellovibrio sp.]
MQRKTRFNNSQFKNQLEKITCDIPLFEFHIYMGGWVSNCCFSWMPTYLGNINEHSLLQLMENRVSKEIRASMQDGSYKFCDCKTCPFLNEYVHSDKMSVQSRLRYHETPAIRDPKHLLLFLDYDQSCNLYCESCRNERIHYTTETAPESLRRTHLNVVRQIDELIRAGYKLTIQMTGSGDVFTSSFYWSFLKEIPENYPANLQIITNGQLLNEERLNYPYLKSLDYLSISVDAATEKTYETVRRGGKFSVVKKNIETIDRYIQENRFGKTDKVCFVFVVQKDNFREMPQFVEWIYSLKSNHLIWFNLIADWGHLTSDKFNEKAVWKKEHPDHREFLEVLKNPVLKKDRVLLGNVSQYMS